ncbi:ABC transporter G family member 20-like isoform X2 [Diorhabda sublineata]|uniref:ABC transporter G family member 20-like isoform X2 n=2 Tax=Diorhabda sublineata TaxID=1163346 RepID=UPI0024E096E7|nr:ABC transporter G family member 20-like isoform X2 [Diorhabda sublineata]
MLNMYDHLAVCIKEVEKSYGPHKILNKLCLNVERGSIYGLLGSSGCGKTTLLRCITGRIKIDSGEIYVLGEKQREIPGAILGYMPQSISLIAEFTVKDTIYFFGRIYDVPENTIKKRYHELVQLLDLPTDKRYIKNCSGGEQRRISFAASMVHQPKLLILDEPTVGTDPILRDRVWKYLLKISQEDKTTIVITTHYIEETREANRVGLMREGTILTEENPEKLVTMYNANSLEEVFFILSSKQEKNLIRVENQNTNSDNVNLGFESSEISLNELTDNTRDVFIPYEERELSNETKKTNRIFAWRRFKALVDKNYKTLTRNYVASLFPMFITIVQVLFFLVAVGRDTTDNPFGIVNAEQSAEFCELFPRNETAVLDDEWNCHIKSVSCLFEDYLNIPSIKKIQYNSVEEAIEDLKGGKIRGFIQINSNISQLMEKRLSHGISLNDVPNEELEVFMDMTSLHIGGAIKSKIYDLSEKFHEEIHRHCKYLTKIVKLPLRVEETYFGSLDDEFTIFLTPGIVTTMIYFMGCIMTCIIIVEEKCEGIWDRSIIAGVTSLELSMSHLIYQIIFMIVMTIELMILVFCVFRQPYVGSLWLIFALIYLQGLAGIVLGFGISVLSTTHLMANVIVSGIFNPLVISSGVMWPIEAINEYLLWIVRFLPLAQPTTALRYVIKRGWSLKNLEVIEAIGILLLWTFILLVMSIFTMKRSR